MKVTSHFTPGLFATLGVGFGCGSDTGMIDPGASRYPGFSAVSYSSWSLPVNLGPVINSASNDQGAFISKSGLVLYFVSTRPGGFGGQDIYVSRRSSTEDSWQSPENLGSTINTASNEASPTLSTDGHQLYFHSNRLGGAGGTDLYVSRRRDKLDELGWKLPENLGAPVNSSGNERNLTVFEEDESGMILVFFDSDRPGGPGGVDIYSSWLTSDNSFGPAVLVPELSSASNDLLPAVRPDGLEILFDSDRPGTLGLRDIWFSTRVSTSDPWSVPVNLTVVNTPANDLRAALSFDGTSIYLSSNRAGGFGDSDLYVSTRTKISSDGEE
jgi:Tol biopolymer transport system component